MKSASLVSLVIVSTINLFEIPLIAEPPASVSLTQTNFLYQPLQTNILPAIIFKDTSGDIVPASNVTLSVFAAVSNLSRKIVPGLTIMPDTSSNVLTGMIQLPYGELGSGSFGLLGGIQMTFSNAPAEGWIAGVPWQTNIISTAELGRIAYLELIDRLAQYMELKTGVLTNGHLIFGVTNNWQTNYVPQYTIELENRP